MVLAGVPSERNGKGYRTILQALFSSLGRHEQVTKHDLRAQTVAKLIKVAQVLS